MSPANSVACPVGGAAPAKRFRNLAGVWQLIWTVEK